MNREDRERMVDRLLDGALAAQDVEPRAGLEGRILASLRAQPERRPWRKWMWVPAVAAAVVLLVIALKLSRTTQPTTTPVVAGHQPASLPAATKVIPSPPLVATRRKAAPAAALGRNVTVAIGERRAEPRLAVFPSPVPLTPEEQMLMALAQRNRPEAMLVAANQQSERERIQTYFETGEAPAAEPVAAPITR